MAETSDASAQDAAVPGPPALSAPGMARDGPGNAPGRPSYNILIQDEDWSSLRDPSKRTDPLDAYKFIKLNADGSVYLTTAIDSYISYRAFQNELSGVFPGYDGYANTRLNVHASLTLGDHLRLYGALKHGDVYDRTAPIAPVSRNRLDLHQAFAEVRFGDAWGAAPGDALIRVGRQEIHYGSGALISARLGPNVRSDYDGVLARVRTGGFLTDAFVYRAVADRFGVFDDGPDRGNVLWGVYSTYAAQPVNIDFIYLGQHRRGSTYTSVASPVDEVRHTAGVRVWSNGPSLGGFTLDAEAEYQFGSARPLSGQPLTISAWNVIGAVSYPLRNLPLAPTPGIEFGANSGDRNPRDGTLGTFRAPDPPGRYFGEANFFGPGNIAGMRPFVDFHLTKALRIRPKVTFFWRPELADGTYTLAPSVLRGPAGKQHFLGFEPGLEIGYQFNPHWSFTGFASTFRNSGYFASNPPNRNITYFEATLAFRL